MNDYVIRHASCDDVDCIMRLLDCGRGIMRSDGNFNQWPVGKPSRETIEADVAAGCSYVVTKGDEAVGTFAFIPGPDVTYKRIYDGDWTDDALPYHVIHRLASTPAAHGIMDAVMSYCKSRCVSLRVDTHHDNRIMQHLLAKHGFTRCGIIYLLDGDPRIAHQWLG